MPISNAELALQVSELLDLWRVRELQFRAWLAGVVDGGPFSNGTYPLQSHLEETYYVHSPASLADMVVGPAGESASSAADAAAAQAAAETAQGLAETARDVAATYRDAAQTARDLASNYRDYAANSEALALGYRNKAKEWATSDVEVESGLFSAKHYAESMTDSVDDAEAAQAAAEAAQTAAAGSASAAASSASSAAASAAAAATFDPALYAELTGDTFSGLVKMNSAFDEKVRLVGSSPYVSFYTADDATRRGYLLAFAGGMQLVVEQNQPLTFWTNNTERLHIHESGHLISNADVRSRGMGRFTGWYGVPSSNEEGAALEAGFTGGAAYVHGYNRAAATYVPVTVQGSLLTLVSQIDGKVYSANPLMVDTAGTEATKRNTEFRTAGQSAVNFGSYAGAWRPSITIQGETNEQFLFAVGPASLSNDHALIHSTRGLILSGSSYVIPQTPNGILLQNTTGTTKGFVYHDLAGFGLLNDGGSWAVHIPAGTTRVEFTGNDVRSNLYRGLTDTNKALQANDGALTYGSWFISGSSGGYHGIALYDGVRYPTFMSNGVASGIYNQGLSRWSFYDDGTLFRIGVRPWQDTASGAGVIPHFIGGQTGGRITVSTSAASGTPEDGDIWIQRAA